MGILLLLVQQFEVYRTITNYMQTKISHALTQKKRLEYLELYKEIVQKQNRSLIFY